MHRPAKKVMINQAATAEERVPLGKRLRGGLWRDWSGFLAALRPPRAVPPGLFRYTIDRPGGRRRIHLRVEPGGAGVLFLDVTEVIHLNPTAALMAKQALDGVPLEAAFAEMRRQFRQVDSATLHRELAQLYALIDRLCEPGSGCPACAEPTLERAPLFSTPVSAPYKADIALTYGCNNACAHCYNEAGRRSLPSLPLPEWRRVLEQLAAVGVPHLLFTGGEATLHPDLPELLRYADSLGQTTGLNTNGRRLSDKAYLQTLAEAGLDHVQITLEASLPAIHDAMTSPGAFAETVRGIENAVAGSVHTITNTTLTRRNADHVDELLTFLHTLGIRTFAMNGMIYAGGGRADPEALPAEQMAPLLIRVRDRAGALGMRFLWYTPTEYCRLSPVELELGARRCNAGEYSLCVEPNGDVLPCQSYYVPAGNLRRDSWEQIWNSALFRGFRERGQDPRGAGLPEKCWECPDLSLCGGGCRLEREAQKDGGNDGRA